MAIPIHTHKNKWVRPASIYLVVILILASFLLSGCNNAMVDRLEWVGKEPPLKKVGVSRAEEEPVRWPVARAMLQKPVQTTSSLWSSDSKMFFRDQRAHRIGDILMVKVQIKDKAALDNKTERKRKAKDSLGVPNLFGLEKGLTGFLPGKADPSKLISTSGNMDNSGEGLIEREEVIEMEVAAVVTQVLPNKNLVIYGSQEVRVNYETRQLTVKGVIRPEDISPTNEIPLNKIAEARISYGGKGLISDVQQPRIGNQVMDILSPW